MDALTWYSIFMKYFRIILKPLGGETGMDTVLHCRLIVISLSVNTLRS